ncbi:MAG TPA: type VI secretion system-associated protein TagO [Gemmatimonadales bacterium]|jgi:hypothetical protein|nr:type VI secretion system-associated protein TagO [Gemmatimonadales bacterium]
MRGLAVTAAVLFSASSLSAQASSEQLARCAAVTIPALRLQCYDNLAKPKADTSRAPTSVPADATRIDDWVVSVDVDPITDRKGVTFMLLAEGANQIDTPTLIIRCTRGELDAYVAPDQYLGSDNNEVVIRFGTEEPVRQRWSTSSNHTALFYPGGRSKVEEFVRKLAQYERVAIQVTPYSKSPMAMVFNLAGIGQVNQQLWTICPPGNR